MDHSTNGMIVAAIDLDKERRVDNQHIKVVIVFGFSGKQKTFAKSAIYKEILSASRGFEDDRPIHSLLGDHIKDFVDETEEFHSIKETIHLNTRELSIRQFSTLITSVTFLIFFKITLDDEPMWAADHVVASTPGFAITIPETANKFAIKGNHLTLVKGNQFDGRTKIDPHKYIHEFLGIYDMFKYKDTENEDVHLMMFPLSLTGEAKTWLDKLNEGTIETWDELRTAFISRFFPLALFDRLLEEICNIIKIFYHGLNEITQEVQNAATDGIFLYKTQNQAYQLLEDKVLLMLVWAKNQKTKSSLKKTVAFAAEGNSNSDTDKIMARIDAMTIKMDAQYKELQSRTKQPTPDLDDDDIPMSREEEAKFMQTFLTKNNQASIQNLETKFDRLADKQSGRPSGSLPSNTQPNPRGNNSKAYQPPQSHNEHVNVVFTRSGKSYDPPVNPNDQQNNSETTINFDSDDEDDEPTP
ncbi:reverse transcriptase domain-containing protein [Tanacetum coccineum]|uniref:Reverse transcriptase domain-containing protein n=1 Tax=Tanacetum coccineum TaxID=301880 RepID=A0ABQ4ZE32_9ASTR